MSEIPRLSPYVPEEGRYEGLPESDYHGLWDACNVSRLQDMKRSAAFCKYRMHNPRETVGASLVFGSAVHHILIQPDTFTANYVAAPACPEGQNPRGWTNTKKYKDAVTDLEATGATVISAEQYEHCEIIHANITGTPSKAQDILNAMTGGEVSYAAKSPTTGVLCKLRTDIEVESAGIICDIKTTKDASPREFERAVFNYAYHERHAFYMDRLEEFAPGKWKHHVLLVIENTPPFEFRVYEVDGAAAAMGKRTMDRLLNRYAACEKSGEWPGYTGELETIGVPAWAYTQEELEDE